MKNLNKLNEMLLGALYALPLFIIGMIIVLQIVFDFNMIIYCALVILMGVLCKPWINFVEKKFKKQN